MTIGYILDDTLDRSDGVQQAMLNIGEHMRSRGHDVHYIVTETQRTDIQNVHSIGRSVSVKFNGNSVRTPRPASTKAVKQLFADVQFDVLHVQMPFSPFLAARVLKHAPQNVRTVGTFHILPYNKLAAFGTSLLGVVARRTIKDLDACYAVSEPARQFMQRSFGVAGSVLPNPVDYSFFHAFKKVQKQKKQIVFVGRFEERKGVRELVSAYVALDPEVRKLTDLHMIGKGPLHDAVKKEAAHHGLSINFPGFVTEEEKAQYLANADIAVFPSISGESFGIVLVEAMAAGAGVTLGGDNPGYASVLAAWPEALFDPRDTDAFTRKLTMMIADDAARRSVGALQHAAAPDYDIAVIAERLLIEAYSNE